MPKSPKNIDENVDVGRLLESAQTAGALPPFTKKLFAMPAQTPHVRMGVARDEAFNFYYQDNLDLLEHLGAKLVSFSPLHHEKLPPDVDILYIGGGFPELFGEKLSTNKAMIQAIRDHADAGKPIYAECGGLMYLSQGIIDFEERFSEMVGILPIRTRMEKRRMALGYVEIITERQTIIGPAGTLIRGHEFHWSSLEETGSVHYSYKSTKRRGNISKRDGIVVKNVLASYAHLHFGTDPERAKALIESAKA